MHRFTDGILQPPFSELKITTDTCTYKLPTALMEPADNLNAS
jgi:hypothetical protein